MAFDPLPDVPIEDAHVENPFYDPGSSAAHYIEMTVTAVQKERRQKQEHAHDQSLITDTSTYRYRIHAASLADVDLLADSSVEIPTSPSESPFIYESSSTESTPKFDNIQIIAPPPKTLAPKHRSLKILKQSRQSESASDGSFELSQPEGNRLDFEHCGSSSPVNLTSSDDDDEQSSGSDESQPNTPRSGAKDLNMDITVQSDRHLAQFYKKLVGELENQLYGPNYGSCTPQSILELTKDIDRIMPGIRLQRNINALSSTIGKQPTYLDILGYLSQHGLLSPALLDLFRGLDGIVMLDLRETLKSCSVLVPPSFRVDLLQVLARPDSFPYLTQLTLNGTSIDDDDLRYISHLPALSKLSLAATKLRNEAIAYLVPLKSTLCSLTLAHNTRITDDACSYLAMLISLSYLDIFKTNITIIGLRRLARDRPSTGTVEANLTIGCFEYLSSILHSHTLDPSLFYDYNMKHDPATAMLIENPIFIDRLNESQLTHNILTYTSSAPDLAPLASVSRKTVLFSEIWDTLESLIGGTIGDADEDDVEMEEGSDAGLTRRKCLAKILEGILTRRKADRKVLDVLGWLVIDESMEVEESDIGLGHSEGY